MKKYIFLLALIFIQGCSGGGDSSSSVPADIKVNLLGTWNYDITTKNSICDGLVAKGIVTFQSLNGDLTKIGNILIQGEFPIISNIGNCVFTTIDEIDTNWSGRPAVQTEAEHLAFEESDKLGNSSISSVRIDTYTNTEILQVDTYTDTTEITTKITR